MPFKPLKPGSRPRLHDEDATPGDDVPRSDDADRALAQLMPRLNELQEALYADVGQALLVVLFDGSCGLCGQTIAVVRALDLLDRVEILDLTRDWDRIAARFPMLDRDRCLDVMHLVRPDGTVRTGFEAYRVLARVLPLGWLLLPLFHAPGSGLIGPRIYAAVGAGRQYGCRIAA